MRWPCSSWTKKPVRAWARDQGISGDFLSLTRHPRVVELVQRTVDELNRSLSSFETIKRFSIFERALDIEHGELTPTMKVRRKVVIERFRTMVESLYSES